MAGRAPRVAQVPQVAGEQIQPLPGRISRPLCRRPGGVLGGVVSGRGSAGGAGPVSRRWADAAPSRPDLASPVLAPRWGAGRGSGGRLCSASGSSPAGRRRLDVPLPGRLRRGEPVPVSPFQSSYIELAC